MLADLKEEGFRVSLWQLPYFNPRNRLHREAIEKDLVVLTASGDPPVDDAVIDLSKPEAERWYREKLAELLEMGVGIFTADFGEAAPLSSMYASRKGGFHEHNLYPLRYNKAVARATEEVRGNGAIFSRSAWAGSQRYPLHWGGDAENSDGGMAGTRMVELRYQLMPYVYAQAAHACRQGHPMLRTLFFEYPEDRTSWLVDLDAPLMEEARSRDVYLPPGLWSDYQDGETYEGARWHVVPAGEVPVVMLVRDGAAVPHARLAQSTGSIEWGEIELKVFATGDSAKGYFCHSEEGRLHDLRLVCGEDGFALEEDPLGGRVNWTIRTGRSSRE